MPLARRYEPSEYAPSYLYPSEFAALAACDVVPLERRWLYAVVVYTYARFGELAALECEDIDVAHDDIHIHRAVNGKTGAVHEPKTAAGNRHVPIEPALKALLLALMQARGGTGRLFPTMPAQRDAAKDLRADLVAAGVTRDAIYADDATRKNLTFHDLRATGVTWCVVRGDDGVKIQRRAGHEGFDTTLGYIREAESRRAGFGSVFPQLPEGLWSPLATGLATVEPIDGVLAGILLENLECPRRESNPHLENFKFPASALGLRGLR